jgi:hypothetical protein
MGFSWYALVTVEKDGLRSNEWIAGFSNDNDGVWKAILQHGDTLRDEIDIVGAVWWSADDLEQLRELMKED